MRLHFVYSLSLLGFCLSHKANPVKPLEISWQQWHMKEEHGIEDFDAQLFFKMHDIDEKGYWQKDDILYIYGLSHDSIIGDGSGMGEHDHDEKIPFELKEKVIREVSVLLKAEASGNILRDKWLEFNLNGGLLPDFGTGPGHHLDFEQEYETHHWNKYHRDSDPDVHIKHKEDIEHELLHHAHEIEETHGVNPQIRAKSQLFLNEINLSNIPTKYRSKK